MGAVSFCDVAYGYNSGFSTVSGFYKNRRFQGFNTWASTTWGGFKTAIKANQMAKIVRATSGFTPQKITAAFIVWGACYSVSALTAYGPNQSYGCGRSLEPNFLCRITPKVLCVTRIGLIALEYSIRPQKAVIAFIAMGLAHASHNRYFDEDTRLVVETYLPIAAKVTILAVGDPLSKVITAVELIAMCALSQKRDELFHVYP